MRTMIVGLLGLALLSLSPLAANAQGYRVLPAPPPGYVYAPAPPPPPPGYLYAPAQPTVVYAPPPPAVLYAPPPVVYSQPGVQLLGAIIGAIHGSHDRRNGYDGGYSGGYMPNGLAPGLHGVDGRTGAPLGYGR